jgi:DNA repair protein RadC
MSKSFLAEERAVYKALDVLAKRLVKKPDPVAYIDGPGAIRDFLQVACGIESREVFYVVFLDARHGVISSEKMFSGGLTGAAIYVGEVAKRALRLNAAALVVAHNHPSGVSEPSSADRELTERLRSGLAILEIRLLDHLVFGNNGYTSFAERGWL